MRCPLCGIEMRVQARGDAGSKTLLRFGCRNKACSNYTLPPAKDMSSEDDPPKIVAERMVDT